MIQLKALIERKHEEGRRSGLPEGAASFPVLVQRYFSNISGYEPAEFIARMVGEPIKIVLVVGVGGGRDHFWLEAKGHRVVSLDLAVQPEIQPLVQADMVELPFIDESFDVVVIADALEHTFGDLDALRESWRVLRTHGSLVLNIPFGDDAGDHHVRVYTEATLSRLFCASGFEIQSKVYRGIWPYLEQYVPGARYFLHGVNLVAFVVSGRTFYARLFEAMSCFDWRHGRRVWVRRLFRTHGAYLCARKVNAFVDFGRINALKYEGQILGMGRRAVRSGGLIR